MKNKNEFTNEIFLPLFKNTSLDVQDEIKNNGIIKTYSAKQTIFEKNIPLQYIYFVVDGTVHIVNDDSEGKEQIVSILKKGSFFPHVILFENAAPGIAVPMEETTLLLVPLDYFRTISLKYPQILVEYSKELSKKILELKCRLEEKVFDNTFNQIVKRILYLADEYGEKMTNEFVKLKISLTHEELAQLVGTTRETISRTLTSLKKTGALEISQGEWLVNVKLLNRQLCNNRCKKNT